MAPIKSEEQLKDKLEKRSLQPSTESWSKLSERLDAEEKKSKNPWFWWMGIAAGLIIMIAIAVQTFGSEIEESSTMPKMVEEESIEQNDGLKQLNLDDVKVIELAVENDSKDDKVDTAVVKKNKQIINYKPVIQNTPKVKIHLAETNGLQDGKKHDLNKTNKVKQNLANETMINKNAVVKALNEFKSENPSVTDREVDSLLKLASKELFKDKLRKETSKTVDANSLLLEVEEEMGQSFRTKVYEALKESFETVKTAVAERNN